MYSEQIKNFYNKMRKELKTMENLVSTKDIIGDVLDVKEVA